MTSLQVHPLCSLFILLTFICLTNAEVNMSCSLTEEYCPDEEATFLCNTTNKLLEWTIKDQEVDFTLIDKAGAVECGHHCNVSGVLVQSHPFFSSLLTITVNENLNNTPVQCLNVVTGTSKHCLIRVRAPPNRPMGMNFNVLNSTSVLISWQAVQAVSFNASTIPQLNIEYKVTAKPTAPCETCRVVEAITEITSLLLSDLELLVEYEFSVKALNCFGKLMSEPQSRSVKLLQHNISITHEHCTAQFNMYIEWDGYDKQSDIEITIGLFNQSTMHSIQKTYAASENSLSFVGEVSQEVMNLSANTTYEWTVLFTYSNRTIQIGSGLFNTSVKCQIEDYYSVATVAGISFIGIFLIILLLGAPVAIILAGVYWMYKKDGRNKRSSSHNSECVTTLACKDNFEKNSSCPNAEKVIPIESKMDGTVTIPQE